MKLSVSLPDEDVAYVDEYAKRVGASTRSSVLHRAIQLLRMADMETAYAQAWQAWDPSEDARLWDTVTGDGIGDASR